MLQAVLEVLPVRGTLFSIRSERIIHCATTKLLKRAGTNGSSSPSEIQSQLRRPDGAYRDDTTVFVIRWNGPK
jgi:hypothetical protein